MGQRASLEKTPLVHCISRTPELGNSCTLEDFTHIPLAHGLGGLRSHERDEGFAWEEARGQNGVA